MATIKPIEARSIHQIQSGQVIVDLCSVVKELVENSLDAGASSLDVRFKNYGLDSIEVQDNGSGISPSNYDNLALKHYTSKLGSYEDLSSLETFGFRGEALSSLCALSSFHITTAMADEAPKGKKLEFDSLGKLRDVSIVAAQKGTTAYVEGLFEPLPVRRKELARNVKKEYGKVLGLLHAYACISTNTKFSVKSSMAKGKSATVFATNGNPTTKENVANIYGAKTLSALVPLNLQLAFHRPSLQKARGGSVESDINVVGHISRPMFGEGRSTPDRQMFFVNGRPCGLPQISKAVNEVYKSFNVSQSPFIFADLRMDTNAYDVNVSPDKRTIMLHDCADLVELLKSSLTELFDQQEQSVPQSQLQSSQLPAYKQLTIQREITAESTASQRSDARTTTTRSSPFSPAVGRSGDTLQKFRNLSRTGAEEENDLDVEAPVKTTPPLPSPQGSSGANLKSSDQQPLDEASRDESDHDHDNDGEKIKVRDFNRRIAEQPEVSSVRGPASSESLYNFEEELLSPDRHHQPNSVQNAFDRVRPNRPPPEVATITIGDKVISTVVGSQQSTPTRRRKSPVLTSPEAKWPSPSPNQAFSQRLKHFAASGQSSVSDSELFQPVDPEEPSADDDEVIVFDVVSDDEGAEGLSVSSDIGAENDVPGSEEDGIEGQEDIEDYPISSHDGDDDVEAGPGENSQEETTSGIDVQTQGSEESELKAQEAARVADLIQAAEANASSHNPVDGGQRKSLLKFRPQKSGSQGLQTSISPSLKQIEGATRSWQLFMSDLQVKSMPIGGEREADNETANEEERLALTVSRSDFSSMLIAGQFNLGFILAVRVRTNFAEAPSNSNGADELFIVDQHASDEKFNFERLQAETTVSSQRLVQPKVLDLTAVEEEILIENVSMLEKNGFLINIDDSGAEPIGQRCKLISLPLSKEVTLGLEDLEELLHLIAESPGLSDSSMIPRPSKVRKMFAMRACRSSIMIGKTLTDSKMRTTISHMGDIDKPWNCPHGRPTMRHLMTLDSFEPWREGDGICHLDTNYPDRVPNIWNTYTTDE